MGLQEQVVHLAVQIHGDGNGSAFGCNRQKSVGAVRPRAHQATQKQDKGLCDSFLLQALLPRLRENSLKFHQGRFTVDIGKSGLFYFPTRKGFKASERAAQGGGQKTLVRGT